MITPFSLREAEVDDIYCFPHITFWCVKNKEGKTRKLSPTILRIRAPDLDIRFPFDNKTKRIPKFLPNNLRAHSFRDGQCRQVATRWAWHCDSKKCKNDGFWMDSNNINSLPLNVLSWHYKRDITFNFLYEEKKRWKHCSIYHSKSLRNQNVSQME